LQPDDARAARRAPAPEKPAERASQNMLKPRRARDGFSFAKFTKAALASLVFAWAVSGGVDAVVYAASRAALGKAQSTSLPQPRAWLSISWVIDEDGDGKGDLANPTEGPIRGADAFGSGKFGAGRDKGKRAHHGVDYVAKPGGGVNAPISGKVTREGFAYRDDALLRYIEITNTETMLSARILYVAPSVREGQLVTAGEPIGLAQNLAKRYPGITNHVHVELRNAQRTLIDASTLLPTNPIYQVLAAAPAPARL
jgi:peptidoglycan LD-endopeptidase LytH